MTLSCALKTGFALMAGLVLQACSTFSVNHAPQPSAWRLMLKHDRDGNVLSGDKQHLVNAVRQGCDLRVAWGARRAADPSRTIEHISSPLWVAIRDGDMVEVQLDDFLINLSVLGEPNEDHPARQRFGGTEKVVMWRANFRIDGNFDAVWYDPTTGALIERVPQRHAASWFADCVPGTPAALFPEVN